MKPRNQIKVKDELCQTECCDRIHIRGNMLKFSARRQIAIKIGSLNLRLIYMHCMVLMLEGLEQVNCFINLRRIHMFDLYINNVKIIPWFTFHIVIFNAFGLSQTLQTKHYL